MCVEGVTGRFGRLSAKGACGVKNYSLIVVYETKGFTKIDSKKVLAPTDTVDCTYQSSDILGTDFPKMLNAVVSERLVPVYGAAMVPILDAYDAFFTPASVQAMMEAAGLTP